MCHGVCLRGRADDLPSRAFQSAALNSHKESDDRIRDLLQRVEERAHRDHRRSDPEMPQEDSNRPRHLAEKYPYERTERLVEEGERSPTQKRHIPSVHSGDEAEADCTQSPDYPRKRARQNHPDTPQSQEPGSLPDALQALPRDIPAVPVERVIPGLGMGSKAPGRSNRPMQVSPRAIEIEAHSSVNEWLSSFEH
jgi:hypothetical protein